MIFVLILILLPLCFAGCDNIPDEPVSVYDEPRATAVINDEKNDKETDIEVFGNWSERDRYAQFHYKIEGEAPEYNVRISPYT